MLLEKSRRWNLRLGILNSASTLPGSKWELWLARRTRRTRRRDSAVAAMHMSATSTDFLAFLSVYSVAPAEVCSCLLSELGYLVATNSPGTR